LHQYALIAADLHNGAAEAPSFTDAVNLHRLLHTIEQASAAGVKQQVRSVTYEKS
jgi:hypothetical protein